MKNSFTMPSVVRQILASIAVIALFFASVPMAFAASSTTEITNVTLTPGTAVNTGESIKVTVSVSGIANAGGNHWKSTDYRFGNGDYVCENTTDYTNPNGGTATEEFYVNAPLVGGDYGFEVRIYHNASCNDNNIAHNLVVPGEISVTEPIEPPQEGSASLTIVKEVDGDDFEGWSFDFESAELEGFTLSDSTTSTQSFTDIATGTYSVTELVVTNWEQASVVCDSDYETISGGMTVTLENGDNVTCTFTNTFTEPSDDEGGNDVDTLDITNPAENGDTISGTVNFNAEYVDHDEIVDSIAWAIRFGTCAASTGTVAGNVDGFNSTSSFEGTTFTATLDTTAWDNGEYCFVVNPQEQNGEPDLRETRMFMVQNTQTEPGDDGDDEGGDTTPAEDETNTNGGQTTGTRLGARTTLSPAPLGQVLGASTTATQCGVLIHDYLRAGEELNTWEVMKLQFFLTGQGFYTPATGIFDADTEASVSLFQAAHPDDILAPWDITEPTGYVYKTTLWKLNNMVCPGSQAMPIL